MAIITDYYINNTIKTMKKILIILMMLPLFGISQIVTYEDLDPITPKQQEQLKQVLFGPVAKPISQPVIKTPVKPVNVKLHDNTIKLYHGLKKPKVNINPPTNFNVEIQPIPSYGVYRYDVRIQK
jgi:hypothetical protein